MVFFANNCQNVYEKQVIFNASRNHKFQGVKINVCVVIALFSLRVILFKKVILKWVGGTGEKTGLNVQKWSFSQGLSWEFFQLVPDTSEHSIFHLF